MNTNVWSNGCHAVDLKLDHCQNRKNVILKKIKHFLFQKFEFFEKRSQKEILPRVRKTVERLVNRDRGSNQVRGQSRKTFYGCNFQILVIS